jgi:MFS family permease
MSDTDQSAGRWRRAVRGNVFALGVVSLLTDVSSEMIYPILPVFFTGLVSPAAAAIYIGLMDGIAESTSSLLKIYSGRLSDKIGSRKPLALAGYAVSTVARPLMAIATAGWNVVVLRFFDRIGKGVRTSPRDALISESIDDDVRGIAFSFHRLMDHVGAVGGPLFAAVFLYFLLGHHLLWSKASGIAGPDEMRALRWLFGVALIPGLTATFVLWKWAHDVPRKTVPTASADDTPATEKQPLPRRFRIFLLAVILFTLGNSSDLFLIFYAQTHYGLGLGWVIALWVMLHISKIIFSLPGGRFSDWAGRRPAIIIGWTIYVAVYVAMPFASQFWVTCLLLIIYGAYYGMTEGAERALVADFVPSAVRGKAYGLYHGAVGLAALPASIVFGVLWAEIGPVIAFLIGASCAAAALVVLVFFLSMGGKLHRYSEITVTE